jgi:hypothetical protein
MHKRNRTWLGKIQRMIICTGLALCLVAWVIPSTPCHARELVKPEVVLPDYYPDGFHGFGRIDAINRERVVIDDCVHKLSPAVTYGTPRSENASIADFRPGVVAGFLLNARKEVVSLWLIERTSPR